MDKINQLVEKFLHDTEIRDMQDFNFLNRLIEIYERHYKEPNIQKYKSKIPFNKSYKYSYDFLKILNPSYAEYLKKCKNDGTIDASENQHDGYEAFSTLENDKNRIYIPIYNTIEDSYALTHEVIHDMSLTDDTSLARHIFCEVLSLTAEGLQYDYLSYLKVKDCHIEPKRVLRAIKEKCEICRFEQQLVSIYLDKAQIHETDIARLNNTFSSEFIIMMLNELNKNDELSIDVEQRYVIGYLLSCYIIDRIKENKRSIQEFFDLNEMINYYVIDDIIDYLDLEFKEGDIFDLTDKSYDKIEKSYIKRIKGR